jgi:hypothetical protein
MPNAQHTTPSANESSTQSTTPESSSATSSISTGRPEALVDVYRALGIAE